jgi:integrase
MNNEPAKIILFPQKTKKGFPLKIRILTQKSGGNSKQYKYIGLKYFLTQNQRTRYWNEDKKELRPSYPHYEEVMKVFENEIKKLNIDPTEKGPVEFIDSGSLTQYLKSYMNGLSINKQYGLLQKTTSVYNHLRGFRKHKGKPEDIPFSELSIDFLNDLQLYFVDEMDLKPVTQKGYFESVRRIINKAIIEDKYSPKRHPFMGFEFKRVTTKPKCLDPQQFRLLKESVLPSPGSKLVNVDLANKKFIEKKLPEELRRAGHMFLFQYYAYGMRVSDLLLLQWKNIYESSKRIKYVMTKTGNSMDLALSNELLEILFYALPTEERRKIFRKAESESGKYKVIIDGESVVFNKDNEWFSLIRKSIHHRSTNKDLKNLRIFSPIPADLDVKGIFSKVQSYTSYYNKDLKDLAKEIELDPMMDFPLSSHIARHTFAYLSLLSGQDYYYISKALNHKSIKTTEAYLSKFDSRQLDGKFYKLEMSAKDKQAIDNKLKEILASNDYEKKKKVIELFNL